jgi:hypothetical protein
MKRACQLENLRLVEDEAVGLAGRQLDRTELLRLLVVVP